MTDITDQVCQWVREGLAWNSECGNGVGAEFYDGSPDEWPTSYTYEYEERLHRRRKVFLIVATCFILAGLGFTALLIGG